MEMLWLSAELLEGSPFWQALPAEGVGEACNDLNKLQNTHLPLGRAR